MHRSQKQKARTVAENHSSARIGIAVAEFNSDVTRELLLGALVVLKESGVVAKNIKVVTVPGSFELPLACQKLAETGKYHALVALGCVIKGETDHYHYVSGEAARGLMDVSLKFSIPIGFGVLTVHTLAQAKERSGKKIDAGGNAARAALQGLSR